MDTGIPCRNLRRQNTAAKTSGQIQSSQGYRLAQTGHICS